jgi:hypothetical protein
MLKFGSFFESKLQKRHYTKMKLKFAIVLFLGSIVFASCSKKQCPAYGQVDNSIENESVKV